VENVLAVGKKSFQTYLFAAKVMSERFSEITIKARGNNIKRAVDLAEALTKRFLKGWEVKSVNIDTDQIEVEKEGGEKQKINVSTIEIVIKKSK